ncbi:MAG TPA: methyl-accepting chemotaxis protein, partial [Spirochaetales bacterium]|nr:methyl-accepting chemotaxis protein [Spirochaetales bacterium]
FTTAQKNVKLASLSGRLLLSTIFSVLFTAFAMLLALKGYSDKGTEVSLMQRILEMIPLILILTGWSIYLVGTIVNSTISRIRAITKRITEITDENGDLTQRISLIRDDDIGLLAFAFNTFVETIETLIGSAKKLTNSVADSAEKLNSSSDTAQESMNTMKQSLSVISEAFQHQNLIVTDTKSRIDDLVSSIQEVADQVSSQSAVVDESSASITEMAANIANVSKTSEKADEVAEELKKQADEGGDALKASIEAIKDLESTSQNVRVIVGTISKIASQTNLLAMNAAIEAAHAGEAGSGFAVVADEVRTLAESAAKSAKDIISLIKNMIDRISQAVTLADKAGNAFQGILAGVESTSELVRTIAASMEEQRLGTEEILKSTRALIDATHTIKEVTGEQRIESADMLAAMEELTKASNNIIVSVQEEMKSIKKVNEAIMLVKEESHANKERVKSLANSLMQFKIRASEN